MIIFLIVVITFPFSVIMTITCRFRCPLVCMGVSVTVMGADALIEPMFGGMGKIVLNLMNLGGQGGCRF